MKKYQKLAILYICISILYLVFATISLVVPSVGCCSRENDLFVGEITKYASVGVFQFLMEEHTAPVMVEGRDYLSNLMGEVNVTELLFGEHAEPISHIAQTVCLCALLAFMVGLIVAVVNLFRNPRKMSEAEFAEKQKKQIEKLKKNPMAVHVLGNGESYDALVQKGLKNYTVNYNRNRFKEVYVDPLFFLSLCLSVPFWAVFVAELIGQLIGKATGNEVLGLYWPPILILGSIYILFWGILGVVHSKLNKELKSMADSDIKVALFSLSEIVDAQMGSSEQIEARPEARPEVRSEVRSEARPEVHPEVHAEPKNDTIEQLKGYHELFEQGILTEEEFKAKKQELLNGDGKGL